MANRTLSRFQIRLTGAFILVSLIPLAVTSVYSARTAASVLRQQALHMETMHVENLAANIQAFSQSVSGDITLLANLAPMKELLEAIAEGDPAVITATRQHLADELIAVARTRDFYFKIRFLDATGQEIVEVTADGDSFHVGQGDELQNESQDDYFINGMTLAEGQVYATRLRLETQGGVIVTPHIPSIHYVAPVFYTGERRGIVVTNLDARSFLDPLQEQADKEGQTFLVDADGFYLSHPDEAKRWGSPIDLNTGERLAVDFPDLVADILSGHAGTITAGGQIVTHTPVFPEAQGPGNTWTLVQAKPLEKVLAPVSGFRNVFLGLTFLALILAVGVGVFLSQTITRSVLELSVIADRVATAAEELSAMTEEINVSAGQVTTTVQEVAQGATTQASQTERISRSIEALAVATDQIAQNAQQTEQTSDEARAMVNNLAQMMQALQHRSEDINRMAGTVKRFADQTNLLALNAAIEAARAGEHGKSFAVVADEVRRLAESSRHTVGEIASLNDQVQTEVQQVLAGMEDIVATVNHTVTMARQNADATARQRQESGAVVSSVNDMASVTEEQAAGAEEMAAAVEQQMAATEQLAAAIQELSEMAAELHGLVARFLMEPQATSISEQ